MAKLRKASVAATGGGVKHTFYLDPHIPDFNVQVNLNVTAGTTGSFTLEYTLDDPWGDYATDFQTDAHWVATSIATATADAAANITHPFAALRVNSAAGDRTADVLVLQSGITS